MSIQKHFKVYWVKRDGGISSVAKETFNSVLKRYWNLKRRFILLLLFWLHIKRSKNKHYLYSVISSVCLFYGIWTCGSICSFICLEVCNLVEFLKNFLEMLTLCSCWVLAFNSLRFVKSSFFFPYCIFRWTIISNCNWCICNGILNSK